MKKLIIAQFIILLFGTVFAWINLGIETYDFLNNKACSIGCSAASVAINPIYTPCFYGAMFFMIAFILSAVILREKLKEV